MKICNSTHWSTQSLRPIIARVAAEELEGKRWQLKRLQVDVVYSRCGTVTGCAYIRGTHATLRIPKAGVDPVAFAWLCAHEFAHTRGMRHPAMPEWLRWLTTTGRERYAWAATFPIVRTAAPTKPSRDEVRDRKLAHAEAMLRKAETRVKRATTIQKKWQRRLRSLRRPLVLAAGAAG